jgi:hypothetical protein
MPIAIRLLICPMLAAGMLFASGCNTGSEEEFQTFSTEDAARVELERQARNERRAADEAKAAEAESSADILDGGDTSSVVLIAARTAAQAAVEPAGLLPESITDAEVDVSSAAEAGTAADSLDESGSANDEELLAAATPMEVAARKAAEAVQAVPEKREIQLLVPERSFAVEGPDGAIRVSYDDFDLLKVLNMEPVPADAVDHFPQWLLNLDGKRVRVRGFMYPTFQESGLRGFTLARDNQICCFGRNPKIYDLVEVTLADGVTTDYIQGRPFDVVGIFHIRPEADGDQLWQLYQMDEAIVIDE